LTNIETFSIREISLNHLRHICVPIGNILVHPHKLCPPSDHQIAH